MPKMQSVGEFLADAYVVQNENLSRARQALETSLSKTNMHWLADTAQEFAHLAEKHGFAKLRDFHTVLQELYRSESQRLPAPNQQRNYHQQLTMFLNHVSHCVQHALRRVSKGESEGDIKATLLRLDGSNFFLRRFLSIASQRNIWSGHNAFDKILLAFLQEQQDTLEYFLPEATNLLESLEDSLQHFGNDDQDKGVNRFFRVLHTFKGSSYMVNLTEVGDICHLLEDALSLVREGNTPSQKLMPIFKQGVQVLRDITHFLLGKEDSASQHLGLLLSSLRPLVKDKTPSRDLLAKLERLNRSNNANTTAPSSLSKDEASEQDDDTSAETLSSMRVNTENLDTLMALSSELILSRRQHKQQKNKIAQLEKELKTAQAHIKALYQQHKEPKLKNIYQQLQQSRQHNHSLLQDLQKDHRYISALSYRMREEISQTRMVPMSQLFLHLRRLVEQLAAEHDAQAPNQRKHYRLETLGEGITMDGGVLEELIAPMRHLINNAVIHGIEPLHERAANGKLPQGVVRLEATKHDNHIRIDIEDDGRGLNFNEIQAKALEKGLRSIEEIAVMTEPEVLELILLPGFSTAQRVGKHAGRGVGLDAVVNYVNMLKGRINISSTFGQGTRFSLEIPASITSNKVLSIQVGHKHFSLPAERVVNLRRIPKALRKSKQMMEKILLENHVVTYYDLKQLLGISTPSQQDNKTLPVVMMQDGQETVLLGVDNFGKLEPAIIYPLPPLLEDIEHLMGVSLMQDGRVLPLLNSEGVQELHTRNMLPHYAKRALSDSILLATPQKQRTKLSQVREHILIAEDSKTVREVVAQWLRREGFRVTAMPDGQQAFEYLLQNRVQNPVNLLLTDIEMPHMDGYELIEALNTQLEQKQRIPIIVMSSRVKAEHQSLAMDLGASAYLTKPVQATILMEHIHMLLAD